ncbi:hypothetical protein ADT71_10805, partial [Novosphingobium sp. ST904]
NGLGLATRLRGQSRVPLPPHRITGTIWDMGLDEGAKSASLGALMVAPSINATGSIRFDFIQSSCRGNISFGQRLPCLRSGGPIRRLPEIQIS